MPSAPLTCVTVSSHPRVSFGITNLIDRALGVNILLATGFVERLLGAGLPFVGL